MGMKCESTVGIMQFVRIILLELHQILITRFLFISMNRQYFPHESNNYGFIQSVIKFAHILRVSFRRRVSFREAVCPKMLLRVPSEPLV